MQGKRKSEPRGLASVSKMAEEEGFAGRSAPSPRCAPTALAGYAGKRCRVSSAPPPHGFESTQGIRKSEPHGLASVSKMAGYVRVSANTYAYGLRRGFALLVTGVTL